MKRETDLAEKLFGNKRLETGADKLKTTTIVGKAVSNSENGYVAVEYEGNITFGDEQTNLVPTGPYVKEGDTVLITAVGGTGKSISVTNVQGWGDRMMTEPIDGQRITNMSISGASIDFSTFSNGVITGSMIQDSTIEGSKIKESTITNSLFADGTIEGSKIKFSTFEEGVISGSVIQNSTLEGSKFKDGTIEGSKIKESTITNSLFADGTIEGSKIKDSTITGGKVIGSTLTDIPYAGIKDADINVARVADAQIASATIHLAQIDRLNSEYAHITEGVIDNAKIDFADINDVLIGTAQIDDAAITTAKIENAAITNSLIKNGAVTDEKVLNLSANKLTAGTIDAAKINVTNLHARNLIVDKLNGQPVIGGYTYISPGSSGYSSKNPSQEGWYEFTINGFVRSEDTEVDEDKAYYMDGESALLYDRDYIDSLEEGLNQRIDGAVETWTGDHVPTLENYPAADWLTDDAKSAHVGDIYFVTISDPTDPDASKDGYNYRFAYDNTQHEYVWVLIKDSDVTKALGEITSLQEFESETTSWINETEEGLTTIRQNHTALSGIVDKTVKSSTQLWFTKANTTAPTKPTSKITSTATTGNGWRTVVPAWNASYPNYYYCWQFELADGTYSWSDVVRDIAMGESQGTSRDAQATADANIKSSVQLWFTKANSTAPAKPTAQVTTNNPATGNAWNLAVPTYSASYPHYFYCYQQQKGDGTYQWSDVVYDKGTTEAMQKAQAALPSSTFTTFQTTTFKTLVDEVDEQSSTIATMSETMQYGGANLLPNTGSADGYFASTVPSGDNLAEADDDGVCYTRTLSGTGNGIAASSDVAREDLKQGVKYTMTLMVKSTAARSFALQLRKNSDGTDGGSYWTTAAIDVPANTWTKLEGTITVGSEDQSVYARLYYAAGTACTIYVRNWQLERGEIATEWSPSALDLHEVSNTVNSVKQTADANSANIASLTSTVNSKADGSTVTALTSRTSRIEQTLDGFGSTVGAMIDSSVMGTNILTGNALNPFNWTISAPTGANYTKTAYGTAGAKVEFTGVSGYEWLYSPAITVKNGHKYTLSVEYTVGVDYSVASGKGGFGLSAYSSTPPFSSYDSSNSAFLGRAQFFEAKTSKAMKATITFTATSTTVYLGLNGGQIADSSTRLSFTMDSLKLVENVESRMSSAETQISQNANAISLRATKSETYQLAQPNLAPMFSSHNADGTYPNGGVGGYWQPSTDKAYNRSFFTALADGWMHVEAANNSQKEFVPARVDDLEANDRVTMLVEWRNASWTGNGAAFYSRDYPVSVQLPANWTAPVNTASGEARHTYTVSTADGTAAWNGLINWTFTAASSSTWTGDIRISFYKEVYDSNTNAYIQYAGPYKPYSGSQLYASQAELKVANDNISSKVSTTDYTGTKVASLINQSAESVKIQANHVEIDGTTVFKNGSTSTTVANYVGGVADDAVNELEIGGRNLLRWTSKPEYAWTNWNSDPESSTGWGRWSTAWTITNTDEGIKGTSNSANPSGFAIPLVSNNAVVGGEEYVLSFDYRTNRTSFGDIYLLCSSGGNALVHSNAVTASTTDWKHYEQVVKWPSTSGKTTRALLVPYIGTANDWLEIRNGSMKLEKGNKATDWSPAPEDHTAYVDNLQIGGKNLLLRTAVAADNLSVTGGTSATLVTEDGRLCYEVSGASTRGFFYGSTRESTVSPKLEPNTTYIYSAWVKVTTTDNVTTVAHNFTSIGHHQVYNSESSASDKSHEDIVARRIYTPSTIKIGEWTHITEQFTTNNLAGSIFGKYVKHALGDTYTVYVYNMQLEKGSKATDWSPAPEDYENAGIEYIVGTQTAATGSWTGVTKEPVLTAGKTIAYKLPYAGSGNASLQLKDSAGNNVGGNIAVYTNTSRVTTHFGAGAVINMTYDGTYWRANSIPNTNNYDRRLHNNYVKAAGAVTAWALVCGTSSGYKQIAASVTFDLSYPILVAGAAWTSGTQYANAYEAYPSVNPATTGTVEGIAVNKMVYLKGTVSGNTFTVAASNFLTCNVPTSVSDPTVFYIPLGIIANDATTKMYFATSKDLYTYIDDKFRQVNPTDIIATQKIYYRSKVSGTVPVPTSWITLATNKYNDTASVGNGGWSTKITPIASGTGASVTKYLYLYTCEQRKRLDGTVKCLPSQNALLDDSTTVIDGGTIVTGSIAANKVSVTDLQAFGATIGGFAIDSTSIHTKDVAITSNADNSIGLSSSDFTRTVLGTSRSGLRFAVGDKFALTGDGTLYANGANLTNLHVGQITDLSIGGRNLLTIPYRSFVSGQCLFAQLNLTEKLVAGETYTLQLWGVTVDSASNGIGVYWGGGSNAFPNLGVGAAGVKLPDSNKYLSYTFTVSEANASHSQASNLWLNLYNGPNSRTSPAAYSATLEKWKLEKGTVGTDWTIAQENNSQMIKIDTSSRSFTVANWKTYGAVGYSENWTTGSSYDNSRIKVGDTAYIIGTVSDGPGGTATIIGTVTAVNGANGSSSITMTSQQLIFGGDTVSTISSDLTAETNRRKAVYATSSTAAGTADKVATCANYQRFTGSMVTVTFSTANTAATPTLNVNSTGKATIKGYTGAALTAAEYKWAAGATITFTFDGTYWRMQDGGALQAKADAASSASTAGSKATAAANSATAASNSASAASTSETNAANSASTASSKATAASNSATAAANSASAASTSETNAANSASTASSKATAAANSATAAANSATEAANRDTAFFGTCGTAAGTKAKVVTCTNFKSTNLKTGTTIVVRCSTAQTYVSAKITLNVNSTGAKDVYAGNAVTSNTNQVLWAVGAMVTFVYNGSQWVIQSDPRNWYGSCTTAAGTQAKAGTLDMAGAVVCKGTTVSLLMSNTNTHASPTLNVGSTAAKALYIPGATTYPTVANGYSWFAGATVDFMFDGQYWRLVIPESAKFATALTSNGVMVHKANDSTSGVQITDQVDIIKSGNSVASFQANKIELGKNSASSVIEMCGAKVSVEAETRTVPVTVNTTANVVVGKFEGQQGALLGTKNSTTDNYAYVDAMYDSTVFNNPRCTMISHSKASSGAYYGEIRVESGVQDNLYGSINMTTYGPGTTTVARGHIYAEALGIAPVSLYANESAAFAGAITLSETAANFTRLELFCKDNDGRYCYTQVWHPNGRTVNVTQSLSYGGNFYVKSRAFVINNNKIDTASTSGTYHTGEVNAAGSNNGTSADNIKIVKVIGYR